LLRALARHGLKEGENLVVGRYFMDTKRTNIRPDQIHEQGQRALAALKNFHPDLVVTLDDNAAREVMLPLVDTGVPVIFSGINTPPETYNRQRPFMNSRKRPGHNVTGVVEKLHAAKALQVMREIMPDLERVVLVVDESPTGKAIHAQLKRELSAGSEGMLYSFQVARDFSEYKRIIRQIEQDDSVGAWYPACSLLRDGPDAVRTVPEILAWSLRHCRKPAMAASYDFVRMGLLGGASVDFSAMGEQAGEKAAALLAGTPAGVLEIEDAAGYALVFNLARARQLGILIPPDLLGAADQVYERMDLGGAQVLSTVLVLHGGGDRDEDVVLTRGLLDGLAEGGGTGNRMTIRHLFLHLESLEGEQALRQAALEVQARAETLAPDLVVALGDSTLSSLLPWLLSLRVPVVFGGVHAPRAYYRELALASGFSFPGPYMTGVFSPYQLATTLAAMKMMTPKPREVAIVTLEGWPWLQAIGADFERTLARDTAQARAWSRVKVIRCRHLSRFREEVLRAGREKEVEVIGVLLPFSFMPGKEALQPPGRQADWLLANLNKPSFVFSRALVRRGFLLGTAMDGVRVGERLAGRVRSLLAGREVSALPLETLSPGDLYLNQARARTLGVRIPLDLYEAASQVYSRGRMGEEQQR